VHPNEDRTWTVCPFFVKQDKALLAGSPNGREDHAAEKPGAKESLGVKPVDGMRGVQERALDDIFRDRFIPNNQIGGVDSLHLIVLTSGSNPPRSPCFRRWMACCSSKLGGFTVTMRSSTDTILYQRKVRVGKADHVHLSDSDGNQTGWSVYCSAWKFYTPRNFFYAVRPLPRT
jgi:hypothetical protein